jgi:hypothetical protein
LELKPIESALYGLSNMDQLPHQIVLFGSWSSVEVSHQLAEPFVEPRLCELELRASLSEQIHTAVKQAS